MLKTTFKISKMDCPAEEQMIRAKLEGMTDIQSLMFDIPKRQLEVYHTDSYETFFAALESLKLDTKVISSEAIDAMDMEDDHHRQSRVLWQVLAINFFFFVLEIISGFIAGSMGLVADSLDMLADSIVYGLSLFAVGGTVTRKKKVAGVAGYFQTVLAILGFAEVIRRLLGHGETPDFLHNDYYIYTRPCRQCKLPVSASKVEKQRSSHASEHDFHFYGRYCEPRRYRCRSIRISYRVENT